jgi:hydroxymethylpyrimidine pyrophosphatase-like HAD family hydrolase
VRRRQMAGIGDTKGDLPFLDIVGYSAAPSNAHDIVKVAVDYVSPQAHAYGVAGIISKLNKLANEAG